MKFLTTTLGETLNGDGQLIFFNHRICIRIWEMFITLSKGTEGMFTIS